MADYTSSKTGAQIDTILGGTFAGDLKSSGILFGGDTAEANKLDDYEEGVWVPVASGSFSGTVTSASGTYTKIGNKVILDFTINSTGGVNFISTSRYMQLSGLPYTTSATILSTGSVSGARTSDFYGFCVTTTTSSTSISLAGFGTASVTAFSGSITYTV